MYEKDGTFKMDLWVWNPNGGSENEVTGLNTQVAGFTRQGNTAW